jgi:NADH-quinone oxidoreductase subunit E
MSVRRLAAETIQPTSFAFSNDNQAWAERKIAEYPVGRQQSAVIPLLWRAQEQEGWVSRPMIEHVAKMLGMAYIRVLEVATFYTMFQLKPVGTRAHIQVCGTTPCMLRGAEDLREVCQHKINHEPLETNPDGTMSWEEVECMGACVNAPMVMIGKDTYEDLTVERFEEIVDAFAAGKGDTIKPGTQIDRIFSAPEGGPTTLLALNGAAAVRVPPARTEAPAALQEPTTPGRKREVSEEGAPAIKGPSTRKVSTAKAEAERAKASEHAVSGEPAKAMRPDATGAESPAGKTDGGKAPGKATRAPAGDGAGAAGTAPQPPDASAPVVSESTLTPTAEKKPTRKPRKKKTETPDG